MSGIPAWPRLAGQDDLETLAAIEAAAFESPWSPESLHAALEPPRARAWLVLDPGTREAQGYALFLTVVDEAELLRIAVVPRRRRRGVARALLAAGLDDLDRRGIRVCHLEVRADNQPALALYAEAGFREVGRRPRYYPGGVDAVLLTRG